MENGIETIVGSLIAMVFFAAILRAILGTNQIRKNQERQIELLEKLLQEKKETD